LAILDGLSYNEKTRKGGPDGTVAASVQLPGAAYEELKDALDVLQESQKALKRTNALTLADLIALSGAEAVAAVGGPEISVQLGRTDNPNMLDNIKAVSKGGLKEAEARGIAPAFDAAAMDPLSIKKAFLRSGFTDREAVALLGTLATLQSDAVVNAAPVLKEDKGEATARGKMGRGGKANANYAIDLYGTNEGDEDASVDKFEGDVDDFYIADAFGSRKEAYGRRVGDAKNAESNFNKVFADLDAVARKGGAGRTPLEKALLADPNARIWVQKYGQERLTYLKDLSKTFYRITQVGAQYTGGKYAALLDNRGPDKLE
jgi:catalase (peroxidase I)